MTPTQVWICSLVTAMLGGGGWLARLIAQRAWLRDFLDRVRQFREDVVLELEQTIIDKLSAARAVDSAGGEEITAAEMLRVRDAAVARLKDYLGIGPIERALKLMHLPVGLPGFINGWLVTQVEAAVKRLSILQAAANRPGIPDGSKTLTWASPPTGSLR